MGRVVYFNKVVASKLPDELKVEQIQKRMMSVLEDLDKRFLEAIQDYDLDEPENVLFSGYNPVQMYDVVVPVQTLFTRADIITTLFKTVLRWMTEQYPYEKMSTDIKSTQVLIMQTCTEMRDVYVNGYCRKMASALRREIAEFNPNGEAEQVASESGSSVLNGLLQRYLGVTVTQNNRKKDPAMQMLISMIQDLGTMTGHKKAADELVQAVKHIDD